ncbi:MAG: phospholipid carrier-dependent glycosyltransferase [Phycisphaerales bacterium]|nr:phospholipid carrier-dependent glycosyltransferase [Phycisphaerales bacterium]
MPGDDISFREEPVGRSPALDVLVLLAFSSFLSLWGLVGGPGLGDHEAIVPLGARQIRETGEWLIPEVNDLPFIRKPPLAFWLAAAASYVVDPPVVQPPVSPLAARLPSALAAIATTLVVYGLGRSMFGHRIGMVSGAVMAASAGTLFFSHNAQVEMVLTLFGTMAFAGFWWGTETASRRSRAIWLCYASLSLAMMAKAPMPLGTVCLPLAVWWFFVKPAVRDAAPVGASRPTYSAGVWHQIVRVGRLRPLSGIILFGLLFLPWPIYVYSNVENALYLWKIEFVDRYSGELSGRSQPFWYYLPIALALTFPFSLSLPEALAAPFRNVYREHRKGLLFALTWATIQLVFLSISAFKRPHYLIGALPAFSLLLGPVLDRLFIAARAFDRRRLHLAAVVIVLAIPVGLVLGAVFVQREYADVMRAYLVGGLLVGVGAVAGTIAFVRRRRAFSLATLCVSSGLAFGITWDAIGLSRALNGQVDTMADQLRAESIGAEDRLTWVVGRPDARLAYSLGREIQPLFSPLEVAPFREGRATIPESLVTAGADRLRRLLAAAQEEYFIIDADFWDRLRQNDGLPAREVLRVPGDEIDDTDDDWVVITNPWNTGEEEDRSGGRNRAAESTSAGQPAGTQ